MSNEFQKCDWIKATYNGETVSNLNCKGFKYELKYPCPSSYSSCKPYSIRLFPGSYIVEVYGGKGGGPSGYEGKGGYINGQLKVQRPYIDLYAFVGSAGTTAVNTKTSTTFGGGGSGYGYIGEHTISSGGGASDLRFIVNDFSSRIIVAGGGGGAGYQGQNREYKQGGDGSGANATTFGGLGATQFGPGINGAIGTFGLGGNSITHDGCGGGGGYYGGSGGLGHCHGGGGGSGFANETFFSSIYWETGINSGNGMISISLYNYIYHTCKSKLIFSFKILLFITINIHDISKR